MIGTKLHPVTPVKSAANLHPSSRSANAKARPGQARPPQLERPGHPSAPSLAAASPRGRPAYKTGDARGGGAKGLRGCRACVRFLRPGLARCEDVEFARGAGHVGPAKGAGRTRGRTHQDQRFSPLLPHTHTHTKLTLSQDCRDHRDSPGTGGSYKHHVMLRPAPPRGTAAAPSLCAPGQAPRGRILSAPGSDAGRWRWLPAFRIAQCTRTMGDLAPHVEGGRMPGRGGLGHWANWGGCAEAPWDVDGLFDAGVEGVAYHNPSRPEASALCGQ